jgi:DNA-binding XRE family transcriptional regulator
MKKNTKERLENKGYRFTDAKEFLGLSDEEMALIDLKLVLIEKVREIRQRDALTQKDLAKLINTSQSRVAMIENAASDVSLDIICKALFALGVTRRQLATAIAKGGG